MSSLKEVKELQKQEALSIKKVESLAASIYQLIKLQGVSTMKRFSGDSDDFDNVEKFLLDNKDFLNKETSTDLLFVELSEKKERYCINFESNEIEKLSSVKLNIIISPHHADNIEFEIVFGDY